MTGNNKTHTMHEWHKILGHCNVRDVCKLEGVVEGMKITDKGDFRCDVGPYMCHGENVTT